MGGLMGIFQEEKVVSRPRKNNLVVIHERLGSASNGACILEALLQTGTVCRLEKPYYGPTLNVALPR